MTRFYIGKQEVSEGEYAKHLSQFGVRLNPTLFEKARNLIGATGRAISELSHGNPIGVSEEEQTRRMSICYDCQFFIGSTCRKCGCHIRFKAKLRTEHCPIGKW